MITRLRLLILLTHPAVLVMLAMFTATGLARPVAGARGAAGPGAARGLRVPVLFSVACDGHPRTRPSTGSTSRAGGR